MADQFPVQLLKLIFASKGEASHTGSTRSRRSFSPCGAQRAPLVKRHDSTIQKTSVVYGIKPQLPAKSQINDLLNWHHLSHQMIPNPSSWIGDTIATYCFFDLNFLRSGCSESSLRQQVELSFSQSQCLANSGCFDSSSTQLSPFRVDQSSQAISNSGCLSCILTQA